MAMSKIGSSPGALLVCNGYKDAAFMRLVCDETPLYKTQYRPDVPDKTKCNLQRCIDRTSGTLLIHDGVHEQPSNGERRADCMAKTHATEHLAILRCLK